MPTYRNTDARDYNVIGPSIFKQNCLITKNFNCDLIC